MKTDLRLQKDMTDALKWELGSDAKNIDSEVRDGMVTLAGEVDAYSLKLRAEQAAQRVAGVKSLSLNIGVKCLSSNADYLQERLGTQSEPPWAAF